MSQQIRILFVCLGNICRSPSAEGVFRAHVTAAGLDQQILIESAGTGAWHIGKAPDRRAQKAAKQRGYDLSQLKARQVHADDFDTFDLILAMDDENMSDLRHAAPDYCHPKIQFFLAHHPHADDLNVPDPYYGGDEGFEHMMDLIEGASEGLLAHVRERMINA